MSTSNVQRDKVTEFAAKLSLDRYGLYLNELPNHIRIKMLNKAREIQKVDGLLENLSYNENNQP